jgi:hypothetical protein
MTSDPGTEIEQGSVSEAVEIDESGEERIDDFRFQRRECRRL